jgi:RsiW-degrading membrane proteinase PrsW (M82 family)
MELLGAIGLSVVLGIVPMVLFAVVLTWFDRYEKEPPLLMAGVFLWGLIVAAGAALIINTLFGVGLIFVTGSQDVAMAGAAVLSAPLVEETVKGLAVLAVFVYFYQEFDSVLDGIIYGGLVGFGFAAAENINYIFSGYTSADTGGWTGLFAVAAVRIFLIPFLHGFLTSWTGIGFAVARLNRGWLRYMAPPAGYLTAIALHFFHNLLSSVGVPVLCILGSLFDWMGFAGMIIFILVLVWREGRIVRNYLREEVGYGTLTQRQWQTAASLWGQTAARTSALLEGNWRATERFYNLCGRLAFKKMQMARVGPERGVPALVARLRSEIAELSPSIRA